MAIGDAWRMTIIKTKAELLDAMLKCGACIEAVLWVESLPDTDTAREIWLKCEHADWLAWFGAAFRPKAILDFALECAAKALNEYKADAFTMAGFAYTEETLRSLSVVIDVVTSVADAAAQDAHAAHRDGTSAYRAEVQSHLGALHALVDAVLIGA